MEINRNKRSISLINSIQKNLIHRNLLKPHQNILLSVSGGQDSICLIFFIFLLENQWNWRIQIIYCNHLWQRKSFYIFIELAKITYQLNIRFFYSISFIPLRNENTSRNWRYSIFYRLHSFYKNNYLLTGHTFTDRLETIFFNMLRGSGIHSFYFLNWKKKLFIEEKKTCFFKIKRLKNLIKKKKQIPTKLYKSVNEKDLYFQYKKKIYESVSRKETFFSHLRSTIKLQKTLFLKHENPTKKIFTIKIFYCLKKNHEAIKLIRPLLGFTRNDIKKIISTYKLCIFLDKSNQLEHHSRNRIRNQILPTLRLFFNPQIDNVYFQYSEIGSIEEKHFEYILKKLQLKILSKNKRLAVLDTSLLNNLPLFLQKKLYKNFLQKTFKKNLSFAQIEFFINLQKLYNKKYNGLKRNEKLYTSLIFPGIGVVLIYKNKLITRTVS
jgi:tRNA(Ile)-lysidine synthase